MSWLPGAEGWPAEEVSARLRFLRLCAGQARSLASKMGPDEPTDDAPDLPVEATFEFPGIAELHAEAAQLAFATDRTDVGRQFALNSVRSIDIPFTDVSGWSRACLIGAILQAVNVNVTFNQIYFEVGGAIYRPELLRLGSTERISFAMPLLVTASVASGNTLEQRFWTQKPLEGLLSVAWAFAERAAEFTIFKLSGDEVLGSVKSRAALMDMERRYEHHVMLLADQTTGWEVHGGRAELIDWRLLGIHVALRRNVKYKYLLDTPPFGPGAEFIRSLASELSG